jgi:hypothetical protein
VVTYYKAVRPDGTDFFSGMIDYAAALGSAVKHPRAVRKDEDASHYISISISSGDCTGFRWDATEGARLFEVAPVGRAWAPHANSMPNKRAAVGVKVLRELPSYLLFGPQGEAVVAIINAFKNLSTAQKNALYAARDDAFWNAWSVVADGRADRAGLEAARGALRGRLDDWHDDYSAYGTALAVLLRHTIGKDGFTQEHYDALAKPWVKVTGQKAHPEDVVF